jgi:ADP-ribose pyrophosphatase
MDREAVRFLVVGCHTEHRVLAIASFLRNVLGFTNVATCTYLTGSATPEAYYSALRHNCPSAGIQVFVDLQACAEFSGLHLEIVDGVQTGACLVEPADAWASLTDEQRSIVQFLCMQWTRAEIRPLQGGYSGSALLLAKGWKGQAQTEPSVLKMDQFAQMRREIDGYHQVKDLLGKHVPTFDYPVALGESIGVAMEFAAMEGNPTTLQDTFEVARDEKGTGLFFRRLEKSLRLLVERLYGNTRTASWITPYRAMGLHAEAQLRYLNGNLEHILKYANEEPKEVEGISGASRLGKILKLIAANEDAVESEVCLSHGDLNFQNIICDGADNIWFIDWTHTGYYPVELDFAKLEADVKFVMTKDFEVDDLPRVKKFEDYLLSHRLPASVDNLPDSLNFARWDLRFRKILDAVRMIREACFSVKLSDDWLVYRIAMLRYALHTLSFDKRRNRGECEFPQLMYALYASESLLFNLVGDDFHLRIRGERPNVYPQRQRISIDESLWDVEYSDYNPPYYVDPSVIANDRTGKHGGWSDPEDVSAITDHLASVDARHRDDDGRPLNPRGRTGIAGRGLLGLWGPNPSVAAIITRTGTSGERVDILLGSTKDSTDLELPKGFVVPNETQDEALERIMKTETGWQVDVSGAASVCDGYVYDPRQTDHAWVEICAKSVHCRFDQAETSFHPSSQFEDVRWYPLDPGTINRVPSGQANFVREAVKLLADDGKFGTLSANDLLEKTG